MSWGITAEDLEAHMATAGAVQNCDIMLRRDGRSKVCLEASLNNTWVLSIALSDQAASDAVHLGKKQC
jgi:hypothetical protein